ncbi:MAG: hypothetical protein JXB48_24525, partial [Candidatus Latescibacteria bacterium]|nr:hypothetical protein [Candidatus Latescibacterota bacterium]
MPDRTISTETQESIRSFCRKVTVAYDLNEDIQEELCGHIEDKLLSYLNGEEKLSEQDGLVLVREHFGKPEHIRNLLEEVHGAQAKGSLGRRIGAVVVTTIGVELLLPVVNDLHWFFELNKWHFLSSYITEVGMLSIPVLLWFILSRWQTHSNSEKPVWFQRISIAKYVMILAVFVALQAFSPIMLGVNQSIERRTRYLKRYNLPNESKESLNRNQIAFSPSHGYYYHISSLMVYLKSRNPVFLISSHHVLYIVLVLLAWLWWCDIPHKRFRALSYTFTVWILYSLMLPWILPFGVYTWDSASKQMGFELIHNSMFKNFNSQIFFNYFIPTITSVLFIGLFVVVLYALMTQFGVLKR